MPVRVYDSNPWGFTYADEEDEGLEDWKMLEDTPNSNQDRKGNPWVQGNDYEALMDWKPIEDDFDANQISISKPVKENTGTDPLTTLSSLEQMRSKLSVSDQATLSAIRSKKGPQLGSKGTADTANPATLTIDDLNITLKQMVDKLVDRDRKTFDDLQSKSATRLSAGTTAAPSSVNPNRVLGHLIRKLCKDSTRFPRYSEMLHDINIEDMQSRLAGCLRREAWDICANGSWSHER